MTAAKRAKELALGPSPPRRNLGGRCRALAMEERYLLAGFCGPLEVIFLLLLGAVRGFNRGREASKTSKTDSSRPQ